MRQQTIKQRIVALSLSIVAAAGLGTAVGVVSTTVNPPAAVAYNPGGKLPLKTVMARASWWMATYGVIYSQNQSDAKSDGTGESYRPDCSGFVSMAWHLKKLDTGWDLNTTAFYNLSGNFSDGTTVNSVLDHVAISSLKQGDAVVSTGHIRLFDAWVDSSKSSYYAYEEWDFGQAGRRSTFTTPSSGWKGVRYTKIVAETALTVSKWCQYKVTSGTIRKRSGPGTDYTGEGTYANGSTFTASYETKSAGGKTWRRVSATVWVTTGDSGTFSQTSSPCLLP